MDLRDRISTLAEVMDEFRLSEAELKVDGVSVAFRRRSSRVVTSTSGVVDVIDPEPFYEDAPVAAAPAAPVGTPVTSPMAGIYYAAPSPGSPNFVKEGDEITAGQIIGLIEAMKVFNEIPSTANGTVKKILVESGQLVQPGDTILLVD